MKKRNGFVSNSSSSNFIVIVDPTIDENEIDGFLIPHRLAKIIIDADHAKYETETEKIVLESTDRVLITPFHSDTGPLELFGDPFENKLPPGYKQVFSIDDGNHGSPYNTNDFLMVEPGEPYHDIQNFNATWIHRKYLLKLLEDINNEKT